MKYTVYQASRKGGRSSNEDRVAYAHTSDAMVMVLCDGMGGHHAGEVAAQLTVQTITHLFKARAKPALPDMPTFLVDAIYAAHDAVNEYAIQKHLPEPPRTTCVVCVVQKGMAIWAHVGDSRMYHFNKQGFVSRTRDHSAVQQLVDDGIIDESQMTTHPDRNKLYNSVGGFSLPDIELGKLIKLYAGDVLLMCTDGVWPELTAQEIFATLRAYPLEKAVKYMMDHAEFRSGEGGDNLSVVALRYGEDTVMADALPVVEDLGLDGFSTLFNKVNIKKNWRPVDDRELDEAMNEINAALAKHNKSA